MSIRSVSLAFLFAVVFCGTAWAQPVSFWPPNAAPGNANEPDANPVELGLRFTADVNGTISAIRFYKGPQNTGRHSVSLWSADGNRLAMATAVNETASGWQTVPLTAPVPVTAGQTYVASYHTFGHYADDINYFGAARSNGVLHAPAGAGVFKYGSGGFPNETWNNSNYWVDVVFSPAAGGSSVLVTGQCGPANGASMRSAPSANLCSAGAASAVTGSGPWAWSCAGSNGGATASCKANLGAAVSGGPLPPDRNASANWSRAGMLSVGGIPNRTAVCATVSPLGGGRDDTGAINAAIGSCPAGQVVSLAAGTFTINEGSIIRLGKAVTLRGAGPTATFLVRTNGARMGSYVPGSAQSEIIRVSGNPARGNTTALAADAAQGANSVQVANAAGYSVGEVVLLDEASGSGWQTDRVNPASRKIWASPDYRVTWNIHNPGMGGDDGPPDIYSYFQVHPDHPTNEMHQISAISGNTISFDSPVTISYRTSHGAQLTPMLAGPTNAGVEELAVRGGDNGNIRFESVAYAWAKNVDNSAWLNEGFALNSAFRVQLEGVYVHDAVWPVPGGGGYAISFAFGSSEDLIENSISVRANKVMVARASGAGSVVAYSYMDDGFISGSDGWPEIGLNASHLVGSHHVLFEGNYGFNIDSDQTHGSSIYHTFFRNYVSGYRRAFTNYLNNTLIDDLNNKPGGNSPLRAAAAHAYAYWFSFLGNVLGTAGHTSGWTSDCIGGPNSIPSRCIWELGWVDISPQGYDPNVAATAIRDGNYDYLTNSVGWAASDTAHVLPNSLYLTQKPAFFGVGRGYAWPWVEPTGLEQVNALPAKARFDAGTPFAQP